MSFLYWLETLRNPVLDTVMSAVTLLGDETLFMVIAMAVMWCINKHEGYYLLSVGFLGTQINQLLKVTFRIERPWVRDPAFQAVEVAVPAATGYSFPSGHTQSSVGTFGALARWHSRKALRIVCALLCVLVPFSRMYLGVHTPLDVGVSFLIALVLVFGLYPLVRRAEATPNGMRWIILAMLAVSLAQAIYMSITLHGAAEEELQSGLKNAYKMLGATCGFLVAYELDVRLIRFDTNAVWWAQLLKVALGLALTLAVKELAYLVFGVIPSEPFNRCLAYFVLVIFAGAVWPLTFRFFAKLGKKQSHSI